MIDVNTDDFALQIEYSLVGNAILFLPSAKRYAAMLAPEDFADPFCRRAWGAAIVSEKQEDVFPAMQQAKLSSTDVAACFDALYVGEKHIPWLAERLRLNSSDRKLRASMLNLLEKCTPEELPQKLVEAAETANQRGVVDLDSLPGKQVEAVLADMDRHDTQERIRTGYPVFDCLTGGLRLGGVSVIGALPSTGKTALALNILCKTLAEGKKSAFFSLEMNSSQLWERIAAHGASISYGMMGERNLGGDAAQRMRTFLSVAAGSKLVWLFDDCRFIEQQADRISRLSPQLVIVDYLQVVSTRAKYVSQWEKLEYLIADYKRLALANNCHICILSQHNRAGVGEKASMFSLKGSSAIEQGGDYVAILDRPHVYDDRQPEVKAELKLVKNKYGCVGSLPLWFDGDYQRFRILAEGEAFPLPEHIKEEKPF